VVQGDGILMLSEVGAFRFATHLSGVILLILFPALHVAANQAPEAAPSVRFAPLEKWKSAVLLGDKAALAALYVSAPGVFAQTPQGKSQDPMEEPNFWLALRSSGLASIEVKILEINSSQEGMKELVLRINLTMNGRDGPKEFVVSASQIWIHTNIQTYDPWRIVATQRSDPFPRPAMRLPEPAAPNPNLYPEPEEAQKDLKVALAAAKNDHKRVILVFGGNWCYDCHVLEATFRSKEVAPLVEENFHVVHINIGEFDHNTNLAKRFEVPLEKGVPALAVLDSDGKLVTSQKKGEFESAVKIGISDVVKFLERWKPAATK
jgi:thioredoxin 1